MTNIQNIESNYSLTKYISNFAYLCTFSFFPQIAAHIVGWGTYSKFAK